MTSPKDGVKPGRLEILDLWRSAAIVSMLIYHFIVDLEAFGYISRETLFSPALNAFQKFICCSFILLSGISCRYSKNNVRRGIKTLLCAGAVTAVSLAAGNPIWFGILHFLGLSMVLYGLFVKKEDKTPLLFSVAAYIFLFFFTKTWTENTVSAYGFLFPLGFIGPGFWSADYFPVLPWIFLFLLGARCGGELKKLPRDSLLYMRFPAPLLRAGQHSLIIYLAHQPLLYAGFYLFEAIK